MNVHPQFAAPADRLELRTRMMLLRRLLREAGYWIFDVDPARRKTELDIIAVGPIYTTSPVWIYPSRTGRLVIRSGGSRFQAGRLRLSVPESHRRGLRMMISREMEQTPNWHDWLAPASRHEARLLGLPM